MIHHSFLSAAKITLACLLIIGISTMDASANSKAEVLQRKIADIGLLAQQLEDRRQQAEAVRKALVEQKSKLVAEIRLLRKSLGIKTYQQVKQHGRAYYNVELLRSIIAYNTEFTKKIKTYRTGKDKLAYLHKIAEDDIKMIRTMSDFKVDALTTQISLVINKYLAEAHIIQINPKNIRLAPPEKIWAGIVKGIY